MKILHAGPDSVHVRRFINAQDAQRDCYLITEAAQQDVRVTHQYVVDAHTLNPLKWFGIYRVVLSLLVQLRPDVVHIHQVNRLAFLVSRAAKTIGIPVVTTAWGSDVLIMPQKNMLYKYMVKKTLQRSAIVTADARQMIEAMQSLVPSKDYRWVQYGITPVVPKPKERLIYSNRLHKPLYRISGIIRLFAGFASDHPEYSLVIGAAGPETERLELEVEKAGLSDRVTFVGWLDEEANRAYYARSAIYISIPESDGTSVSLLEAMSAGCIPVVSDLPANREWITDNDNGIIVRENEEKNPLERALELDAELLAAKNGELINRLATRERSVATFDELYKMVGHGK